MQDLHATSPAPAAQGAPEHLRVVEVALFERDVTLRLPFRFGVITLTEAPQAFVRARVRLADGTEGVGMAAELMVPKWFDKSPERSNDDNLDQLRRALALAGDARIAAGRSTPFGLFADDYAAHLEAAAAHGLNPLAASFGPALVDRAILDALCRARGVSFSAAVRANLPGIEADPLAPDLAGFDLPGFLAGLRPADRLFARHTVGMVDPLTDADRSEPLDDGLPETLEEVIAAYGHRHFKLKVRGDLDADVARLEAIAAILDARCDGYAVTLDGNEQYDDVDGVLALLDAIEARPSLAKLRAATLFVEQPIRRDAALACDVSALAARVPVIIDESDGEIDAFPRARDRGYAGVSTKSCKGFYKSLLNAARCAAWNAADGAARYFLSAEDLTCQAGLAVQQDLILVALLGIDHVERNGHHYVDGMAGAPEAEQRAFLAAHPDLYADRGGRTRLAIRDGVLRIGSLDCSGYGSAAEPDWRALREMASPRGGA